MGRVSVEIGFNKRIPSHLESFEKTHTLKKEEGSFHQVIEHKDSKEDQGLDILSSIKPSSILQFIQIAIQMIQTLCPNSMLHSSCIQYGNIIFRVQQVFIHEIDGLNRLIPTANDTILEPLDVDQTVTLVCYCQINHSKRNQNLFNKNVIVSFCFL